MSPRLSFPGFLASVVYVSACLGAQAQVTFSTGANVPVGANFYRGSGGVIDTGTDYSRNFSNLALTTTIEEGNFLFGTNSVPGARGQTASSLRLDSTIIDGSNSNSGFRGNLFLAFVVSEASAFANNEFQARYTFPQTVTGEIGFINGFDVVTGETTPGFTSAFDYAFDGLGSLTITPNGSFTAVPIDIYFLALNLKVTAVPEPASAGLWLALVAGGLVAGRRRRA